MKPKLILAILIIPVILGLCLFIVIGFIKQSDKKYLEKKNFQLIGVVVNKNYIESGVGSVVLNLTKSNYMEYNPDNDNRRRYFCKISNDRAYIIIEGINTISIGDTIKIDETRISLYRDKELVKSSNIFIPIPFPLSSKIFDK
ncbi:hypothetical protein [uncultured Croceitalea sp.]|uniref:hypothetical protein n=1 Tax=uncultured Croceitalea sp. TaxID=1798908 RepID=UPI00374EDFD3